ncbi:NAD(P)/FAD-dependent oxidoreductase [Micromonospora sp. CB01531]|uniref:NAD(P)/FAD-dependent oxidoreductase n=1 Tax=Micromonospora sp. CB01531 TaxID=1718947 RepID=UPI00093C6302|nr:FAD-binding oxidoreductase [Micromonospora sp. CB01531]OKI63368.1 hypothetical protein A6A27_26450 [Micromonospora sp. CB01531]
MQAEQRGYEVVVVGGGVVGMSVALELDAAGTDVLLVDRDRLGGASTSRNAGGVRHQFYQDANILAALETSARLRQLVAEDGPVDYRQVGYLLLYTDDAQRDRLAEGVVRQNALGVDTRMIAPDEIAEIAPDVDLDGVLGACFGPTDGYLDPILLAAALRNRVLRSGVRVLEGTAVHRIESDGDRATGVVTAVGTIPAGTVVNCAGAWAPTLARSYGGDLPIVPRRSQVFVMADVPPLSPTMPHTFDCGSRFYVRPHQRDVWSGAAFKPILDEAPPTPGMAAEWVEAEELARRVGRRVPALAGRPFTRAWAGVIEVTPDDNPVLGWTHLANVYSAAGFSGHGICIGMGLAPSIGAEIRGGEPAIPLGIFRPQRFSDGSPAKLEGLWLQARPSRYEQWLASGPAAPQAGVAR